MRLSNSFGFTLFLLLLREKHEVFLLICLFLLITKVFLKFKRILFGKNIRWCTFKIHPTKISKVGTFSLKQVLSSMPTFISWYLVAFELLMSQEWHSAYFCTGSWKFILSAICCIAQHRLKTWQIYRWIFAHNFTYTCPNDLNDPSF